MKVALTPRTKQGYRHLAWHCAWMFGLTLFNSHASADVAVLVDQAVMVETNPEPEALEEGETPVQQPGIGTNDNAAYLSSGGWAVTGAEFIDAAAYLFDMGEATEVSGATLIIPIRELYPQNDVVPVQVSFYSDNGVIEVTDYSIGFISPIAEVDLANATELRVDVTGAVNSALNLGRFIGFRVTSSIDVGSVDGTMFPRYTGARFHDNAVLEFVPGTPPALGKDSARFDGFTMEIPTIDVPGVGEVAAQFKLVDPNQLRFQLTEVIISDGNVAPPPFSGADLFNCSAFTPPEPVGVSEGVASYSTNSGILDVPSLDQNGQQLGVRLELVDGSEPAIFETLSFGSVQSGPSEAVESALQGGLVTEPAQDFVPLCHGWVLLGDFVRNRVVERNIISGQTGATYPFNTAPDQFTLDRVNNVVYMTVFPESERLYKLDLITGAITYNEVSQTLGPGGVSGGNIQPDDPTYTYRWALRDIALGENGNVFAILFDGERFDPENNIPFADTGLWMGYMNPDAGFLTSSLPLEAPIRLEYDPVQDHVFLATESNLATFNFNTGDNSFNFVIGTDVPVGTGCTDFDISPDGNRLAYTCPNGNYDDDFSIADMDPEDYYNNDGAWFFGTSPVSATFSADGTLLIGTDNERLYVFDVKTHLILEDFPLGLLEGETIRKVRVSEDGQLIYIFLNNDNRSQNSKFYWMPMPAVTGTPL